MGGGLVKVRIELVDDGSEDEVIIRCGRMDETILKIQQYIKDQTPMQTHLCFYKDNQEFYLSIDIVLFFETEGEYVYAHTAKDSYRIKYRLYELEKILPKYFIRSSKSAVINSKQVHSITKNLTASSLVTFKNTYKHVYVSRNYFKQLRQLIERNK